jgi:hypothetical protein
VTLYTINGKKRTIKDFDRVFQKQHKCPEKVHHGLSGFPMLHSSRIAYFSRCVGDHRQSVEHAVTSNQEACDNTRYENADVAELPGISVGRLRDKLRAGDPLPSRVWPTGSVRQRSTNGFAAGAVIIWKLRR